MDIFQIDVKKELQKKSPSLAKRRWFVRWLKKIVHEDGINACLRSGGDTTGIAFAEAVVDFFQAEVKVECLGKLHPQKRYVFVANHPLGGLDGVALVKAIGQFYPELRFPVNDILLAIERFQPIFIPVNKIKDKKQNREAVEKLNGAYASEDQQVLMFPAGLVSRKIKGEIVDLPWQKHFVKKSIEYKRDIVPIYIEGKNSNRFYRIANWRKRLGIKANIEMLFLPDEVFRQKNKTIRIVIGEPIPYDMLKSDSAEKTAEYIKRHVYDLA